MKKILFFSSLLFSVSSFGAVTLQGSKCIVTDPEKIGNKYNFKATCYCQSRSALGEFKSNNLGSARTYAISRATNNLAKLFPDGSTVDCSQSSAEPKKEESAPPTAVVASPTTDPVTVEVSPSVQVPASEEFNIDSYITEKCPNGVRESKQSDGRTYMFCEKSTDSRGPLTTPSGEVIVKEGDKFELFDRKKALQEQKTTPKIKSPVDVAPQVPAPKPAPVTVEASSQGQAPVPPEKTIMELIKLCQKPNVDKSSCEELMEVNPKFADMILQLNEKYNQRQKLITDPEFQKDLSNRDNYELAQKLVDLEFLDEKNIFESFCKKPGPEKQSNLCLSDIDFYNLEDDKNFKSCLNQRISQIEMKNPGASQYSRGAFAGEHIDQWKTKKDCKQLLADDVKKYSLDKFYDDTIKLRDFDPTTCEWFSDLPRQIIRGAVKSCRGDKRAEACVGYVACTRKDDGSKFVRQSTCSKANCIEGRAVACTVEKNYSSKTYIPKDKKETQTSTSGASQQ